MNLDIISGGDYLANCYLLHENGKALLIDFVPEITGVLESKKLFVEKIILTHIHFDHFQGLSDFQKNTDCKIYTTGEANAFLNNPDPFILSIFPPVAAQNIENLNLSNFQVVNDNDVINWNNITLKIVKTPGHSPDSCVVVFEGLQCVFTGDTVFQASIGRTDLPGGNFELIIESIQKLFSQIDNDYKLYPGHGPATKVEFEKKYNMFIQQYFAE